MLSPVAHFRHPSTTRDLATLPAFTPFNPHHKPIDHTLLPTWATSLPSPSFTQSAKTYHVPGLTAGQAAGIVIGLLFFAGMLVGMLVVLIRGQMGWLVQNEEPTVIKKVDGTQNAGDVETGTGEDDESKEKIRSKKIDIIAKQSEIIERVKAALEWLSRGVREFVETRIKALRTEANECGCEIPQETSTATTPSSFTFTDKEFKQQRCSQLKPKGPRDMLTPTSTYEYARGSFDEWSSSEPFRSSGAQASVFKMTSEDVAKSMSAQHPSSPRSRSKWLQKHLTKFKVCCCDFMCLFREKVISLLRNAGRKAPENQGDTSASSPMESTSTSTPPLQFTEHYKPAVDSSGTSRETGIPQPSDAGESSATAQSHGCLHPDQDLRTQRPAFVHSSGQSSPGELIVLPSSAHQSPHQSRLPIPTTVRLQTGSPSSPLRAITTSDEACRSSEHESAVNSLGRAWARAGCAEQETGKRKEMQPTKAAEHTHGNGDEGTWCVDEDTPPEIRLPRYYVQGAYRGERKYRRKRRERFKNLFEDGTSGGD